MRHTLQGFAVFLATIVVPVSCAAVGSRVGDFAAFVFMSALLFVLAPLFIRRKRFLLSYIVLVGGALAYEYIDYRITISQPGYDCLLYTSPSPRDS